MSKRRDPEAAIVEYFLTAPDLEARILFRVIRGVVQQRGLLQAKPVAVKPRIKRQRTNGPIATIANAQE